MGSCEQTWFVQLLNCTLKRKDIHAPFISFPLFIAEYKYCGVTFNLTDKGHAVWMAKQTRRKEPMCVLNTSELPLRLGPPS